MGKAKIRIIHLDSEKGWRGGQQQTVYLASGLRQKQIQAIIICQPGSRLHFHCRKNNLSCRAISMKGELDLISAYRIAHFAGKNGYNIIHAHSAHALATALWVKVFHPEIRVICTRRVDFNPGKSMFSRLKYRTAGLDRIVCISREIEKILYEYGVSPEKLTTIHSGIDIRKFDTVNPLAKFREKYDIPADHIVVGTVAAQVGHKDYPNLLKAARYVTNREDAVTFMALGKGPDEDKIRNLHGRLKLGNRFLLAGFQDNVGAYLKNFSIYVQASKKEGLGTSILDAFAAGVPVVSTAAGGIPELISNRRNGLLVEAGDHKKLGEAVLCLVNDPELRARLSENALIDVKRFDIRETVDRYIALYRELVE